jgi:hypothetical protein
LDSNDSEDITSTNNEDMTKFLLKNEKALNNKQGLGKLIQANQKAYQALTEAEKRETYFKTRLGKVEEKLKKAKEGNSTQKINRAEKELKILKDYLKDTTDEVKKAIETFKKEWTYEKLIEFEKYEIYFESEDRKADEQLYKAMQCNYKEIIRKARMYYGMAKINIRYYKSELEKLRVGYKKDIQNYEKGKIQSKRFYMRRKKN